MDKQNTSPAAADNAEVTVSDLMAIIGQKEVEIAVLRKKLAKSHNVLANFLREQDANAEKEHGNDEASTDGADEEGAEGVPENVSSIGASD